MKRHQLFIIVGIALLLVASAVLLVVVLSGNKNPQPSEPVNPFSGTILPGGSNASNPPLQVQTVSGDSVMVPDFRVGKQADELPSGNAYTLYGPLYSNDEVPFSLQYSEGSAEFLIVLLQEPIGAARLEAERYLRGMLMLQSEELCRLNAVVVVMPFINQTFATYENLGLSFCPGAVALP
jgi:hypothetical protein